MARIMMPSEGGFEWWNCGWDSDVLVKEPVIPETDYLKREDKIISLAREVMTRRKTAFTTDFFEKIKPDYESAIKYLKKQIVEVVEADDIDKINELISGYAVARNVDMSQSDLRSDVIRRTSRKGVRKGYAFSIDYNGMTFFYVAGNNGAKPRSKNTTWYSRNLYEKDKVTAVDFYEFVGVIILFKLIEKEIATNEYDLLSLLPEYKVWRKSTNKEYPFIEAPVFGSVEAAKEVFGTDKIIKEVSNVNITLYSLIYLKSFKNFDGVEYGEHPRLCITGWDVKTALEKVMKLICDKAQAEKRNREYEKAASSDYALSFQTKKNIPQKTIKAMEESGFNEFFGFVEFDERVELDKVGEIEKEFRAFNHFLFGKEGKITSDVSLRFRRLGNHKAAGLYYPAFSCICIDIQNPSSFIHEYGHMLDYHNGSASIGSAFSKIRGLYEELLRKKLKNDKMELKGKYNMNYYLTPTEIFARCFELYMLKIKGMENSIVKDVGGFAYPDDEYFLKCVQEYYDEFFESMKGEVEGGVGKCAST